MVSRQLLSEFSKAIKGLPVEEGTRVCEAAVEAISKRLVSFEEPVSVIRELWADYLEHEEDFEQAARVLEGVVLDSPHRQVKVHYKVAILVRIASLWLLEDDYARAEVPFPIYFLW